MSTHTLATTRTSLAAGVEAGGVSAVQSQAALLLLALLDHFEAGILGAVETNQPQTSAAPSTFTPGTTDQTVFTLAAGERGFIQNLDDVALAVKFGASASTTSFNVILKAGTAANDGNGGSIKIESFVGAVSVAAMSGSPRYIAWKQTI